jgi:hypothetical protein
MSKIPKPSVEYRSRFKEYKSRFKNWDKQAWVRAKPHQLEPFSPDLEYFSEKVAILFQHKEVSNADAVTKRELLILHLFNYLEFTVWLEMGPVNEVCDMLRRNSFLPWLPTQMKDDAFKIYVDEGGHAEMSHSLTKAVEETTNIKAVKIEPVFLSILDNMVKNEEPEFVSMIKLFFVIISETLITGTLVDLPKDVTVQKAVQDLAADHASDEGRHHAYFRQVFEYVWPRMPRELKLKIGVLLPDMILAFLAPDKRALVKILEVFPDKFATPGRIVDEITESSQTKQGILESALPTLTIFKHNNLFDEIPIKNTFVEKNLFKD